MARAVWGGNGKSVCTLHGLPLQRNNVTQESLQTKFLDFKKHQNGLGRLVTMGIARPSSNILIQEVGVGPWEETCKWELVQLVHGP